MSEADTESDVYEYSWKEAHEKAEEIRDELVDTEDIDLYSQMYGPDDVGYHTIGDVNQGRDSLGGIFRNSQVGDVELPDDERATVIDVTERVDEYDIDFYNHVREVVQEHYEALMVWDNMGEHGHLIDVLVLDPGFIEEYTKPHSLYKRETFED